MLKNSLKKFNIIFPFIDFLYILQLEEYDNARYFKTMQRFYFRRNIQKRDTLKYTSRIQTIFLLSIGIATIAIVTILVLQRYLILFFIPISIPLFVLLSNILLAGFYEYMKYRLQQKAKLSVLSHTPMKIIAIAGSYGKTTTKNFLHELLKYDYKTQMIPGNINTPTGIAAWIIKNLEQKTEILLVEMDTYFLGEIKRSCLITEPNISIITSIGDQHLERFGSQKNMAQAILEVFNYTNKNAKKYVFESDFRKIEDIGINISKSVIQIKKTKKQIQTNIESETGKVDLSMALEVLKNFKTTKDIIDDTLMHLSHPDRRQKYQNMNGYEAIDDSYNISFTTACAAVDELVRLGHKKRMKTIVITAGIPELGIENKDSNIKYGEYLNTHIDLVILLKSIYASEIKSENSIVALNMTEAWHILKQKFSPKSYILLVQPELTDLYY